MGRLNKLRVFPLNGPGIVPGPFCFEVVIPTGAHNEATIAEYIRKQEAHGIALGKLGIKEEVGQFLRRTAVQCRGHFAQFANGQEQTIRSKGGSWILVVGQNKDARRMHE